MMSADIILTGGVANGKLSRSFFGRFDRGRDQNVGKPLSPQIVRKFAFGDLLFGVLNHECQIAQPFPPATAHPLLYGDVSPHEWMIDVA